MMGRHPVNAISFALLKITPWDQLGTNLALHLLRDLDILSYQFAIKQCNHCLKARDTYCSGLRKDDALRFKNGRIRRRFQKISGSEVSAANEWERLELRGYKNTIQLVD